MTSSLRNDSHDVTTHDVKNLNQHHITNPIDLSKEPKNCLTIPSVAKAALVAIGTIGAYYLAKTTNILSYFLGSKNPKDVNNKKIVKLKNEEQSLAIRRSLEEIEQTESIFTTRRSYDDIVEFEEMEVEEFKIQKLEIQESEIQEFENLPKVERIEESRRSISIQNPIPDQNATVGNLFELTINGASIFNSNTIFVDATDFPTWITPSINPTFIGSYNTPDWAFEIAISGNYAYIADRNAGLQIIDINNPANPTFKGSYDTPDDTYNVAISGNYAYVADSNDGGLQIINITDPANPTFIGSYDTPGYAHGVDLLGNYAYVADGDSGLQIINIIDPANPTFVGSYDTPADAWTIAVFGNYAYVADAWSGLQIINIIDPANPTFIGSYDTPGQAAEIALFENYAYIADHSSESLQIIDVSNPANPTFIGSYDTNSYAYKVTLSGNYAYVPGASSGLEIIDISDPTNPISKGSYNTAVSAWAIAVSGNYMYVADKYSGLQIIDPNLDKLTLSGTPSSIGTYSVNIRGCNEIDECVTDTFNIIVTDSSSITVIIVGVVAGTVCAIGLSCLSIIIVTKVVIKHRKKKLKEQQIVGIEPNLKGKRNIVKDNLQPVKNQKIFAENDLNSKEKKIQTEEPDHKNSIELDTTSQGLKTASISEFEVSDEMMKSLHKIL